jgi:hypothetical protein
MRNISSVGCSTHRTMKHLYLAAMVAFLLSSICFNTYADSEPDFSKMLQEKFNRESATELREITAVEAGSKGDVYFVSIFNGLIPLPTRYTMLARTQSPVEFNSMVRVPAMQQELIGTITMGQCGDWSNDIENSRTAKLISTESIHGLTVKSYAAANKSNVESSYVLITDGRECLSINDTDTSLWKAMLEFYNSHRN